LSQSPQIGAMVPTKRKPRSALNAERVSIPSNRGNGSYQTWPAVIVRVHVSCLNPLKSGQWFLLKLHENLNWTKPESQSPQIGAMVPTQRANETTKDPE